MDRWQMGRQRDVHCVRSGQEAQDSEKPWELLSGDTKPPAKGDLPRDVKGDILDLSTHFAARQNVEPQRSKRLARKYSG